eukprot:SAG11_NODE_7303_length_1164_cov_2.294836_1_plen_93_part_10
MPNGFAAASLGRLGFALSNDFLGGGGAGGEGESGGLWRPAPTRDFHSASPVWWAEVRTAPRPHAPPTCPAHPALPTRPGAGRARAVRGADGAD